MPGALPEIWYDGQESWVTTSRVARDVTEITADKYSVCWQDSLQSRNTDMIRPCLRLFSVSALVHQSKNPMADSQQTLRYKNRK